MPAYGQQGPLNWPYMRGPAYFDSDLALFKNFQITERQKLQFRISAVNWLNHPLGQFGLAGNTMKRLHFTDTTPQFISWHWNRFGGQRMRLCPCEHRRYYLYQWRVLGAHESHTRSWHA